MKSNDDCFPKRLNNAPLFIINGICGCAVYTPTDFTHQCHASQAKFYITCNHALSLTTRRTTRHNVAHDRVFAVYQAKLLHHDFRGMFVQCLVTTRASAVTFEVPLGNTFSPPLWHDRIQMAWTNSSISWIAASAWYERSVAQDWTWPHHPSSHSYQAKASTQEVHERSLARTG